MGLFCDSPDERFPQRKCNRLLPCPVHQPRTSRMSVAMDLTKRGCYSQAGYILGVSIGRAWLAIEEKFLH